MGWAKLFVYYGLFHDHTSEGRFFPQEQDGTASLRYLNALHRVTDVLQCTTRLSWQVERGMPYQVDSVDDGETIVRFAETTIPGATGIVELIEHMHGMTCFNRNVIIPDVTKKDVERVIAQLMQCGVQMHDCISRNYEHCELVDPDPPRSWRTYMVVNDASAGIRTRMR